MAKMHETEDSKKERRRITVWDWGIQKYPEEMVQVERIMGSNRSSDLYPQGFRANPTKPKLHM
jgi:hypothetical protein